MVVGTTLLKLDGGTYYSPQFNRGGNAANFMISVLNITPATTFNVTVEHKNADDTSWTTLTTFAAITTVGPASIANGGIKEQLRFTYAVAGAQPYLGVHFNVLAPQWLPY